MGYIWTSKSSVACFLPGRAKDFKAPLCTNAYKLRELNKMIYSGAVSMQQYGPAAFPKPMLETGVNNLEFLSTPQRWIVLIGRTRLASYQSKLRSEESHVFSWKCHDQLTAPHSNSSSSEANSCWAVHEIPSLFGNTKVHYNVHESLPVVLILSHINPVHVSLILFR